MTQLLTATAQAWVCMSWQAQWIFHSGALPNSTLYPTEINSGGITWNVAADFGDGIRAISGDAWCGDSITVPPDSSGSSGVNCWCRMTSPYVGPWITRGVTYDNTKLGCTNNCARDCAACLHHNWAGPLNCSRQALLN